MGSIDYYINFASFNIGFWDEFNVHVAYDWIKGSSRENEDIIDVYNIPFCRSSFLTSDVDM